MVALLLILVKLFVGLSTGAVVVLASAVDSMLDFLVSSFNVYAVRSAERPSDQTYNYGRGKMEGVAAFSEGLFILASALYILRQAIFKFLTPGTFRFHLPKAIPTAGLTWAMAAMAFSLLITAALVAYLKKRAEESPSLIIRADTLHYQTDLLSNGGILVALLLIRLTGWAWLDPAIAVGVSLFVARAAIPLLRKGLAMLLDRALEEGLVENIRKIAESHSHRVSNVHELKTRRSGDTNLVEFHLVFDENIKLREAHQIADEIEMRVRALEKARWIINIHLDPVDDSHRDQKLAKQGLEDRE
ncbi:MAG: cation diffusion facilitator family transporter [Fibrobacteres bacterium]|nr:cation diffusion facilitator family transporter [Fibrobacterota bacterium]